MSKLFPGWSSILDDAEREVLGRALRMFAVAETMDLDPSPWHRRRSSAAVRLLRKVDDSNFLRVDEFEGRVVHAALAALGGIEPAWGDPGPRAGSPPAARLGLSIGRTPSPPRFTCLVPTAGQGWPARKEVMRVSAEHRGRIASWRMAT